MGNILKVLLLMTTVLLSACESDQKQTGIASGMLRLQLAASGNVINTTTRGESNDNGDEEDKTEEDNLVPDVGDFSIAVLSGNVVKTSWDKFSEYPKYAVLPVGDYTLKASYGDADIEGFDSPYYEGTQEVSIEDDATIEASITCYLTNVKMSVEYTDAFKKYFVDYSTTVQSAGGQSVTFSKEEVRAAYVKPGAITVYASVEKQNGQSAKLDVLTIETAKSREFYRLTLDVDAGSSTLKISFDNTTEEKPIEISVSDDILNIQPPFFTPSGYQSGEMQEVKEGSILSPLSMLMTARAGISKCMLTTTSTSLLALGWPASVDLAKPDAEVLAKMKSLGLALRGLGDNKDKMATLDFGGVIPNLQYIAGDDESMFSVVVTDKVSRVNEEPEVIKIKTLNNLFALGTVEDVSVGLYSIVVPITLDGDMSRVKYQYLKEDVWMDLSVANVVTEDVQHQVTLSLPFMTSADFQIKAICGARSLITMVKVKPPVFMLQASEADMWATKATIHVVGENEATTEYMKEQSVIVQYAKKGTEDWMTPVQTKSGTIVEITGLPEDSEKENTYIVRSIRTNGISAMNTIEITTEIALQVPNAGFESWNWNQTDKNGNPITKNLKYVYWKKWFPWAENGSEQGWNTLNEKTTQDGASPGVFLFPTPPYVGCCYVANSGTIPTTDSRSGNAALIRTVGWGSGSAAAGGASKKGDAGYLYLGSLDKASYSPKYGIDFASRPSKLTFWCKYNPKNSEDKFIAKIVVLDSTGSILSETQLPESECGAISNYIQKTIVLDYPKKISLKAHKMYILFQSGTKTEPNSDNYDYPPGANLSDGEFVGAQLYIDDVKLVY